MWKLAMTAILVMSASPALAQANFTQFVDPVERAFSVEVPAGWQVTGGMRRRSAMQAHPMVILRSPGGLTEMALGNLDAYTYSVLDRRDAVLGFREGSPYAPGVDHMIKLNYRTGQQFAVMYGERYLAQECQNLQLVQSRGHAAGDYAPERAMNGLTYSATAGDAFFTCERDGHRFEAYVYSQTALTGQPGVGGIWNAEHTYMFLTPEGHGAAAGVVLSHIVKSGRVNPQWLATQLRLSDAEANRALTAASAQVDRDFAAMTSTFAADRAAASDNQAEMERLISGFDEYQTASGERRTVPYAAATNWWSKGGQTVGTQGPLGPNGFQPMTRVPLGQ